MWDKNQVILIVFDLILAALMLLLFLSIQVYPGMKVFLFTLIVGVGFVLIWSIVKVYQKTRDQKLLEKKQLKNIVPSQCPDYWTRSISKDKLVCMNQFASVDDRNRVVKYSFSGKQVPSQIVLNDVASMSNPKKCDGYGAPNVFGAPWVEMQNRCKALNVSYDLITS